MPTLSNRIIELLRRQSGVSDREITDALVGTGAPQQPVNQACRHLETRGIILRRNRSDGRIGNYLADRDITLEVPAARELTREHDDNLSEDALKQVLRHFLARDGWETTVAWGKSHGIDIEARRGAERWIIEVKGPGSRSAMRVNYFIGILGEILQRMDDPNARYSIALPDLPQFRRLWQRLPALAKSRAAITALFVDADGNVEQTAT